MLVWASILLVGAAIGRAQSSGPATASGPSSAPSSSKPSSGGEEGRGVSAVGIESRIRDVQENKAIDEAVRGKAVELYRQALDQVRSQDKWKALIAGYEKAVADAPAMLQDVRARIEAFSQTADTAVGIPADAPLAQVEQALATAQSQAAATRREVADLESDKKERDKRRTVEIPKQQESLRTLLEDLRKQADAPPPVDEPAEIALARRTFLAAQEQAARSQRTALYREGPSYDSRAELLGAQLELATLRNEQAQKRLEVLREKVNSRRQGEADEALNEAKQRLDCIDPKLGALVELAQKNVELAALRTGPDGLTADIRRASDDLTQATADLARLSADYRTVSERAEAAGRSQTLYLYFRRVQASLPNVSELEARRRNNQARLEEARTRLFDLDDQKLAAKDIDTRAKEVLTLLPKDALAADPDGIRRQAVALLKARQAVIAAIKADYGVYITRMTDLDSRQKRLLDDARKLSRFIDERVFWVRSAQPLSWRDLPRAGEGLGWFVSPKNWAEACDTIAVEAPAAWGTWAIVLAFLLALALAGKYASRRLEAHGQDAARHGVIAVGRTLEALVLTLLVALPAPMALLIIGWWGLAGHGQGQFLSAIGAGALSVSLVYLPLAAFREVCRPNGLAESHFHWPASSLRAIRRWIGRLLVVALPLTFLTSSTQLSTDQTGASAGPLPALSRLAFLLLMLAASTFVLRLLNPAGQTLRGAMLQMRGAWAYRLRYGWYGLAAVTPLLLALAAVVGYYYTALQLSYRLLATVAMVLGLIVLHAILNRWLSLARRRLAMDRLKKQDQAPAAATTLSTSPVKAPSQEMDLSTAAGQSSQLVRILSVTLLLVGAFAIWADVLPALAICNKVELWSVTGSVPQTTLAPDGSTATTVVERLVPITLSDLLLAAGMAMLTLAASRNLPGLMEITLLRRLNWDFGSRYAFVTILRYVIIVVGASIVCSLVGIGWAKVQWLLAAMTVGLGFGLQEIFANFISGLILLFERPMRVGDIVTVGDITGTVTRIRIRATTITNLDRKELIVPNKEFITGKLVNWTLSDTVIRVTIPVGVSYASDTQQVLTLLRKIASEQPVVLKDPGPQIECVGFGDSAINFEVRVFVTSYPNMLIVRNQIHTTILNAFREAKIEIPFPQRDVVVRNLQAVLKSGEQNRD